MRIGFVFECAVGGPDAQIYPYVARELCNNLVIDVPATVGSKQKLIAECHEYVQTFLSDGCDIVFIMWDRMPKWGGAGNCEADRNSIQQNLVAAGINLNQVRLCCIDEELESWLIADSRGFMSWIQNQTNHALANIGDHKTRAEQSSPKNRIKRYLRENFPRWQYNDYKDNFDIVQQLPDFTRVRNWNASFKYFADQIDIICP